MLKAFQMFIISTFFHPFDDDENVIHSLSAPAHTHTTATHLLPLRIFSLIFPVSLRGFSVITGSCVRGFQVFCLEQFFSLHSFLLLIQHKNLRVWKTSFVECGSNPLRSKGKLQLLRKQSLGAAKSEEYRRSAGTSLMNSAAATLHN